MTLPLSVLQQPVTLGDLLDVKSFTDVCQSFAELYRVGLKVFDETGKKIVDVKVGNADFCGYIWQKPEGRTGCTATVNDVKAGALSEDGAIVTKQCFSGCRYVVKPVVYEGDVIGRVVFGPFVPDDLVQLPKALVNIAPDFDAALATSYLQKIRRAPQGTFEKILEHFAEILDVLVFTGHKNLLTARLHIEAVQENYRELQDKNRQLENSFAKLKELDRLKSNFLATMSHELRTPLTSVIGYSEMMLEGLGGPLTTEQKEYLGIIMEKGENLLQLITSVLDITKIESGRIRLLLSDVDPVQLVRDSVSTLLPMARKKSVAVRYEPPPSFPKVHWDSDKIRQCLVNLLSNAVKFTPHDGHITVALAAEPEDRVAITVTDSGIGIPPDHHAKIWEVFYQVDGSATREYGGAGLGLAIVKSFVEAHGGDVKVASTPGNGARFTLMLPLRAAAVAPSRAPYAVVRAAS